ncbi:MAG: ABC transporter permease [Clostridiales bacterium]|nr:ABC transporter permease [Clostridiales bacterium]
MKTLSKIYNCLVFAFLYAPIVVMIFYSFNSEKSRTNFGGFSLRWYAELFHDTVILKSLYLSLAIAVLSAVTATIIGTLAAVGINSMKGIKRKTYLTVNNIPVVNPDIVTAISMMILFVFVITRVNGLEMGFWTLLIAHITFNIPYVILSVMPKLSGMNSNIYDAALDLGCPPVAAFVKVVIPEIMQGIVTGFIMAFTLSLDDFVISYFNSGSAAQTLPVTIYSMTKRPYSPKINALSTLLFTSVMILLIIVNLRQSGANKQRANANKK